MAKPSSPQEKGTRKTARTARCSNRKDTEVTVSGKRGSTTPMLVVAVSVLGSGTTGSWVMGASLSPIGC
jgi:hypothetical protein